MIDDDTRAQVKNCHVRIIWSGISYVSKMILTENIFIQTHEKINKYFLFFYSIILTHKEKSGAINH